MSFIPLNQSTADDKDPQAMRITEQRSADCCDEQQYPLHSPWPVAIERDADWQLSGRE